jgi:hypothetical protein
MFDIGNDNFQVYQCTAPNFSLEDHLSLIKMNEKFYFKAAREFGNEPTDNIKNLSQGNWDIVILQDATVNFYIPEAFKYCYIPSILALDSIIKSIGAITILFQPYALGAYPKKYCADCNSISTNIKNSDCCSPLFENSLQESQYIDRVTKRFSKEYGYFFIPIGSAFENCHIKYPSIPLYASKFDYHPGINGSYLMVCLFYRYFTGKKAKSINYYGDISPQMAKKIQRTADLEYF